MCARACTCPYLCVCTCVHVPMCPYPCVCARARVCACVYACVCPWPCVCVHVHVCPYLCVMYVCMCTCVYTPVHTSMHVHVQTLGRDPSEFLQACDFLQERVSHRPLAAGPGPSWGRNGRGWRAAPWAGLAGAPACSRLCLPTLCSSCRSCPGAWVCPRGLRTARGRLAPALSGSSAGGESETRSRRGCTGASAAAVPGRSPAPGILPATWALPGPSWDTVCLSRLPFL